ncbi:MAG: phage tail assembly protein [Shewanella sp.]
MQQVKLSSQTVNMREPKVRDMLAVDEVIGDAKKEIVLISSLTQMTEEELLDLSMKDYALLQKQMQSFLA